MLLSLGHYEHPTYEVPPRRSRARDIVTRDAGKVVHCVELASATERAAFGNGDSNGPVWRIDRECLWADWRQGGRDIPLPYLPSTPRSLPIRPKPGKSAPSQRLRAACA